MRFVIVCGDDDCRKEFYADTKDPNWTCPHCDREIPNQFYPFLSAKLMEAKRLPEEADWEGVFEAVLETALEEIRSLTLAIQRTEEGFQIPDGLIFDPDKLQVISHQDSWQEGKNKVDSLISKANGTIIYLDKYLRKLA